MPDFITRVVLHGVSDHDGKEYTQLHDEMESRGFSRTIGSEDGTVYKLPPAEYYRSGDLTGEKVRTDAKAAAKSVQASFSVLVTQSVGILWNNLETGA